MQTSACVDCFRLVFDSCLIEEQTLQATIRVTHTHKAQTASQPLLHMQQAMEARAYASLHIAMAVRRRRRDCQVAMTSTFAPSCP